jgi:hypothetical protein
MQEDVIMRKTAIFLALLIVSLAVPAMGADISGDWQLKRTGPQGEETWDLTFTATGNEFTVTGNHSGLGEVTGSGTVDGNNLKMLNYLATPMGRIHVQFEGVIDGNTMSGTSQSVGIDSGDTAGGGDAAGGAPGGGAPGGAAPEGAPGGGAPPEGGTPGGTGGAPGGDAQGGGAPGGGAQGGASQDGGSVDHTQPIAFTGVKK